MLTSSQQFKFVLFIPVINVIADSTQDYFQSGMASPGYIRAFLILTFLLIHFTYYYRRDRLNNLILISLLYFLVLGFFSSNVLYTQNVFLKYFITSMMFPVGYYYFKTEERFSRLLRVMMLVLGIYVLSIIISNIFSLGSSNYLAGSTYFGAGRVNMTKAMLVLVLISPASIRFEKNKMLSKLYFIVVVMAVIFILLGVKRSAILGLFIGYFVYFFLTAQKTRVTKGIFMVGIMLFLTSPLYYNTLIQRFEARYEAGRFDPSKVEEEEGRMIEIKDVWNAFSEGNLSYKLFGAELFNSMKYFKTVRMLHTDYATIFAGSGIIGLWLFLLIYYRIFRRSFYLLRVFKSNLIIRDLLAVSITILVAVLITGISGTVTGVGLRGLSFLFWGASFSLIGAEYQKAKAEFKHGGQM